MQNNELAIINAICRHIKNQNVIFVFSSDVVATSFANWTITHPTKTGVRAVQTERFIAWDKFKEQNVGASQKGKSAVPSIMRKIFAQNLLAQNKKQGFFKRIVQPEYKANSVQCASWLAKVLPLLHLWSEHGFGTDEEDLDYKLVYERYCDFLQKNNFFEQAWEKPNFENTNKKFVIVYPELFDDYNEYKTILQNAYPKVELVSILQMEQNLAQNAPLVHFYSDSRQELRKACLLLRAKHDKANLEWNDMALHVPELESIRPYLCRELDLYDVPYILHAGTPLTSASAVSVFNLMHECKQKNYSYQSVRSLLLNGYIPWNTFYHEVDGVVTKRDLCAELVDFGKRNHCVCSYKKNGKNVSTWEESFASQKDTLLHDFFCDLKKQIEAICNAKSFEDVRKAWFIFVDGKITDGANKTPFINKEGFSDEDNMRLGRALEELDDLIEIEKKYLMDGKLAIENHFEFFIEELSTKTYTAQNAKINAVHIYSYKTAAGAFFPFSLVVNANQKSITVRNAPLDFLSDEKRAKLNLCTYDMTNAVVASYYAFEQMRLANALTASADAACAGTQNSLSTVGAQVDGENAWQNNAHYIEESCVYISGAEKSFAGFAIPHTCFVRSTNNLDFLDSDDFIKNEKNCFFEERMPSAISIKQQKQFLYWHERTKPCATLQNARYKNLVPQMAQNFVTRKNGAQNANSTQNANGAQNNAVLCISQSDLKSFCPCARKWVFERLLKIANDNLDANLLDKYEVGNINHKILELLFAMWRGKRIFNSNDLPCAQADSFVEVLNPKKIDDVNAKISNDIAICFDMAINDASFAYNKRPLVRDMLIAQKEDFVKIIKSFLLTFCVQGEKGFGGWNIFYLEESLCCNADNADEIDCMAKKIDCAQNLPYAFFGRIDCILQKDDSLAIVDFKTGKAPTIKASSPFLASTQSDENGECEDVYVLDDFQMGVYTFLVKNSFASENLCVGAFASINECKITKIFPSTKTDESYATEVEPLIKEYGAYFAKQVTKGAFLPKEKEKKLTNQNKFYQLERFSTCSACKYKSICRTTFSVAPKQLSKNQDTCTGN